jgi:uncharacterized membrane protein
MRAIAAALRELVGLFVDDGSLVLAVLLWIGLCAALTHVAPLGGLSGIVLFLGLAVVLAENALRSARRSRRRP